MRATVGTPDYDSFRKLAGAGTVKDGASVNV